MAVSHAELQQFAPFAHLDEEQFAAIQADIRKVEFTKGSFLVRRGRPLQHLTFLLSGRVDLIDASFTIETVDGGNERCREALSQTSPSEVSALAKTDVLVIQVQHQALETLKAWTRGEPLPSYSTPEPMHNAVNAPGDDWMSSLLSSPLFAQVPPTQLQQLFVRFESIPAKAGEMVVQENTDGDYFYVIESGRATVSTRFEGDVASLGPGQFFGEEALVGETIRNASVVMDSDGILMRLDKEDFKALLQEPLIRYLSADELQQQFLNGQPYQLLDVRLPLEHRAEHVPDSVNIPLAALRKRLKELEPTRAYIVTDDGGKRSEVAAYLMCQAGLLTYILKDASGQYGS